MFNSCKSQGTIKKFSLYIYHIVVHGSMLHKNATSVCCSLSISPPYSPKELILFFLVTWG